MKKVLFLCIGNCCRSQMAEGFARKYAEGKDIEIYSAGSHPAGYVHPEAIAAMKELGIDLSKQWSKGFEDVPKDEYEYAVTMGCGVTCPAYPAKHHIDWQIKDPVGQPIEFFRQVRDGIGEKVKALVDNL